MEALPVEARQDPVPLVRNFPPPPSLPAPANVSAVSEELQTQPQPTQTETQTQTPDDLDRNAAKAAVEADGYKRVSIVGKRSDGAWRAKGYRGATEVLLTVDGTGRVSMD